MCGDVNFKLVRIVTYIHYYIMTTWLCFIVVGFTLSQILTYTLFASCFTMKGCHDLDKLENYLWESVSEKIKVGNSFVQSQRQSSMQIQSVCVNITNQNLV